MLASLKKASFDNNFNKEISFLVPEESKEGKQMFPWESHASTLPSLDIINDIFNIHKVKKMTIAFFKWVFTFASFAMFILL